MMNVSSKKVLQYVLFLGIGFALLYLTFKNVNPTELWANIQSVDTMGPVSYTHLTLPTNREV